MRMAMRAVIAITGALLILPEVGQAQLTRLQPRDAPVVGIEVAKPFIGDSGLDWYTSVLRGRALLPVSSSAYLFGDWGVSVAGAGNGTDATFANPEVGVGFRNEDGRPRASLSVILPLGFETGDDDISAGTGIITDIFWPERFGEDVASVNLGFTPEAELGPATSLVADVMVSLLIPSGDSDNEWLSRYGLGVAHEMSTLRLRGGVEGFALLSVEDASFSERTLHRIVLGLDRIGGGPGVFVQLPLDDELDALDAVLGVTFTF